MSTFKLPIHSLRRQQLLLEFASLKHAAPPGVYVSLTPNDPTLWSGIIFVRSGPYASAILRFQIRFPPAYPDIPPLVTFSTDIFHPLIVPLTTYTFSTGASSEDPVSATDEERLPPGGFSLRHGFPHWFGRSKRNTMTSTTSSRNVSGGGSMVSGGETGTEETPADEAPDAKPKGADNAPPPRVSAVPSAEPFTEFKTIVPVAALLQYIRSTFDDETILDSLPLEAAGNPGAWHAWRAHRKGVHGVGSDNRGSVGSALDANVKRGNPQARLPGDWHWDGIWAKRVQDEIEVSKSDAMLYGNAARGGGGDEMMRFSRLDDDSLASIKEKMETYIR